MSVWPVWPLRLSSCTVLVYERLCSPRVNDGRMVCRTNWDGEDRVTGIDIGHGRDVHVCVVDVAVQGGNWHRQGLAAIGASGGMADAHA